MEHADRSKQCFCTQLSAASPSETSIYHIVGNNIKYYRQLYNQGKTGADRLSQAKLAKLAGVPLSLIRDLEAESAEREITAYSLWKISTILHVPIHYFFDGIDRE